MATEAWKAYGHRIVHDLLPVVGEEMALALLRRTADLGQFEPARRSLVGLLDHDGPFGTLGAIENSNNGRLLTQLGIVMPVEVTRHLESLIRSAPIAGSRSYTSSRRDLVWTVEKLAWHSGTFESAADLLLCLATARTSRTQITLREHGWSSSVRFCPALPPCRCNGRHTWYRTSQTVIRRSDFSLQRLPATRCTCTARVHSGIR